MNNKRLKRLYRDKLKPYSFIWNNIEYHAGSTICSTGSWEPDRHYVFSDDIHTQIWTWLLISSKLELPKDIVLLMCKYIVPPNQTYVKYNDCIEIS